MALRTQVGIIGAGPAGLFLSQLLHRQAWCPGIQPNAGLAWLVRGGARICRSGYTGLMNSALFPLRFLLVAAALWLNRQQQEVIVALILRMVRENPSWGYTRVTGALKNVGYQVGRGTIANILPEHGIDPAPLRGKRTTWSKFLKAHWKIFVASDFLTVEVWRLLTDAGCEVIRLPPRASNLNAYAERFVGSVKSECLNRLIFFGESSLRRALRQYETYYHQERNHQGLGNNLIFPNSLEAANDPIVDCCSRLEGMLKYYYRTAASNGRRYVHASNTFQYARRTRSRTMPLIFGIDEGDVVDGYLPRRQTRMVQAWIEIHRDELMAD